MISRLPGFCKLVARAGSRLWSVALVLLIVGVVRLVVRLVGLPSRLRRVLSGISVRVLRMLALSGLLRSQSSFLLRLLLGKQCTRTRVRTLSSVRHKRSSWKTVLLQLGLICALASWAGSLSAQGTIIGMGYEFQPTTPICDSGTAGPCPGDAGCNPVVNDAFFEETPEGWVGYHNQEAFANYVYIARVFSVQTGTTPGENGLDENCVYVDGSIEIIGGCCGTVPDTDFLYEGQCRADNMCLAAAGVDPTNASERNAWIAQQMCAAPVGNGVHYGPQVAAWWQTEWLDQYNPPAVAPCFKPKGPLGCEVCPYVDTTGCCPEGWIISYSKTGDCCDCTEPSGGCPENYTWNPSLCACESCPDPGTCPPEQAWNFQDCECENRCPDGQFWCEALDTCVPDPADCDCPVEECPEGEHWNSIDCECETDCPDPGTCPTGEAWNPEHCRCETEDPPDPPDPPACPPGQCVLENNECGECPPGQPPQQCPPGTCRQADGSCGDCPQSPDPCPLGQCYSQDYAGCVDCDQPEGTCVDNSGNPVPCPGPCPDGQCQDVNGDCVACNPPDPPDPPDPCPDPGTCGPGQNWNPETCSCVGGGGGEVPTPTPVPDPFPEVPPTPTPAPDPPGPDPDPDPPSPSECNCHAGVPEGNHAFVYLENDGSGEEWKCSYESDTAPGPGFKKFEQEGNAYLLNDCHPKPGGQRTEGNKDTAPPYPVGCGYWIWTKCDWETTPGGENCPEVAGSEEHYYWNWTGDNWTEEVESNSVPDIDAPFGWIKFNQSGMSCWERLPDNQMPTAFSPGPKDWSDCESRPSLPPYPDTDSPCTHWFWVPATSENAPGGEGGDGVSTGTMESPFGEAVADGITSAAIDAFYQGMHSINSNQWQREGRQAVFEWGAKWADGLMNAGSGNLDQWFIIRIRIMEATETTPERLVELDGRKFIPGHPQFIVPPDSRAFTMIRFWIRFAILVQAVKIVFNELRGKNKGVV